MKKVLLVVIDALTARVVEPAMDAGRLPNLSALAEAGVVAFDCRSVFPSITPAATASIATGCYPREHGIAGNYWYDEEADQVVYYGADFWAILSHGLERFVEDFLFKLNHQRLRCHTLFQIVEDAGQKAACLNYLIFHGDVPHTADVPLLIDWIPGVPSSKEIHGPTVLYLGDFAATDQHAAQDVDAPGGPFHRLGFDDTATASLLLEIAAQDALPDFTLAYFPDNDFHNHEAGPQQGLSAVQTVDDYLGRLASELDGVEAMLRDLCIVITGDHSQSEMVEDSAEAGIPLHELLADFELADAGEAWESDDQVIACPNLRAAEIYFRQPTAERLDRAADALLADERVDQIMWRTQTVDATGHGYQVLTRDRGRLHFWVNEGDTTRRGEESGVTQPDTAHADDEYGCTWSWRGDLAAVSGHVSAASSVTFSDYPNAFERIAAGLDLEQSGHLWATARPGYEFVLPHTSTHTGGGSHGSLHALDSIVPLLVAGAPAELTLPDRPLRSVDVTPLCLSVLGIHSQRTVGQSHVCDGSEGRDVTR